MEQQSGSSTSTLQSQRIFRFTNPPDTPSNNPKCLEVTIAETIEPHYSQYVWPCAVVLGQYIWYHRDTLLREKHVLEIGAGTALPSIVAAMCAGPQSVTVTDDVEHFPRCLNNCHKSLSLNKLVNIHDHTSDEKLSVRSDTTKTCPIHLMGLTWGSFPASLVKLWTENENQTAFIPDVVLGSDCFYDEALFEDVISTVYYLLRSSIESRKSCVAPAFLCTYQVRSSNWTISDLLEKWELQCEDIPLSTFDADHGDVAQSNMPGNHKIEMMIITLKSS